MPFSSLEIRGFGLFRAIVVLAATTWASAAGQSSWAAPPNPAAQRTSGQKASGQSTANQNAASQATTSATARQDAIRAVPLDKLDKKHQPEVSAILAKPSIYRRLPLAAHACHPDMHDFLVKNPDVVVNVWQTMGISKVTMQRTGEGKYKASDGAGTLCLIEYLHSSHDLHVILADGTYSGLLFPKPVRGKCVLVMRSGAVLETNGKHYVTSRMDVFLQLEQLGVELLAKTFQPFFGRNVDFNFTESAAFIARMSRTAEGNTAGMHRLSERLTQIDAKVRGQFDAVIDKVATGERSIVISPASNETPVSKRPPADPPKLRR